MSPSGNWREIPAETIEEVLRRHAGGPFPPTLEELTVILERQGYIVVEPPPSAEIETALTFHHKKIVLLPRARPGFALEMLLHETAEVLLRQPVAAEFCYPPTGQDEFHAVSTLTVKRIKEHLRQERERLLEQEEAIEEAIAQIRAEIADLNRALRAWMDAIEQPGEPNELPMPDPAALKAAVETLKRKTARLKRIQLRLRRELGDEVMR